MRKLGALLLLLVGCSRGTGGSLPASTDAGVHASDRLREVRRLAAPDPIWSAALSSPRLRAVNGAFADAGYEGALGGVPMAFGGRVSAFADGAFEVRAGDAQVALRVLGARGVQGSLIDGNVVYEDAHRETDFVVGVAPGRVESFWSLHDASAPTSFELALELTRFSIRVEEGALLFVDESGTTRIRMPAPSAIDSKGVRRAASMHLEGTTLTIGIDPVGLTYPILLDPALEQVLWTDLGPDLPPGPSGTAYPRVTYPENLQRAGASARAGNGVVYLFGGSRVYQAGPTSHVRIANANLFEWNGSAWSASAGGAFPDELLAASGSTTMTEDHYSDIAWDSARKKLVLFGGVAMVGSTPHLGVYEYDPIAATWTKLCADDSACASSSPAVATTPSAPSAVYAFGKSILVQENGTYEWDPTAKLLKKFAATPDFKRAGAALAYDANRSRIVAYGSTAGASDTWETDGTTWKQVLTTGPIGVKNPALTYHSARKEVILWASTFSSGGLWSWNGAAWTSMTLSAGTPIPRPSAAFAYDESKGKLLLVGGGDLGVGGGCYNSFLSPSDSNSDLRGCNRVDTWTSTVFGGACTTSADCGGSLSCVDSVCCQSAACGSCERCDIAGSIGKCAKVLGAEDTDTCTGTKSCDGAGVCRKKSGETCTLGTDCLSGNCADGSCCNSACPGVCESCNQAGSIGTCKPLPAGSAGKGCSLYTCTGSTSACATSCTGDADCASNAYCNTAGACVLLLGKGLACTRGRQCATGACVDGVCCDSACAGTCDACSKALGATVDGTCTVLPKTAAPAACAPGRCSGTSAACGTTCSVDGDCATTAFCNAGACVALRNKGESCDRAGQCGAGLACADGVCCNEACDGSCRACSALNKQSGDKSGECGPAKEGTNPRSKCVKSAVSSCGSSGLCDAAGSCAVYSAGTACGPSGSTSCEGELVKGQTCDGLGTCALDTTGVSCSPSLCVDGGCKATCLSDVDCAADGYCLGGTCKKRAAAGTTCAKDSQCLTGVCADGVCCNARCDKICESCDQAGSEGTCAPVAGKPRVGRPACPPGDSANPCSPSTCDGVERASCAKKVGPEVTCLEGSCDGDVESLPSKCDGSGTCPAPETRPCQPFSCDATACKSTCSTDKDCQVGYVCNPATGACAGGDKCAGSIVTKIDGSTVDCAPFICESSGRCKTACATSTDCVSPKICDGNACVDPAEGGTDAGGGCALSPRGVRSSAVAILFAALVASSLRRKRV